MTVYHDFWNETEITLPREYKQDVQSASTKTAQPKNTDSTLSRNNHQTSIQKYQDFISQKKKNIYKRHLSLPCTY